MPITLQNCFDNDSKLRRVFTWLTKIGAAPAFGSRPIGWYQQHQCAAIEYLEKVRGCASNQLRCRVGVVQSLAPDGKSWIAEISARQLYAHADNYCRTGKF
jgi:hypothetical protein